MDIAMNFTLGLSQGIAWPWPIAVYLFLAGISGGAVAVALMLNRYRNQVAENTPVLKAATLVGFVTIVLGMICLVADLTESAGILAHSTRRQRSPDEARRQQAFWSISRSSSCSCSSPSARK